MFNILTGRKFEYFYFAESGKILCSLLELID